ncbi:MAG: hypothetical protein QOF63_3653 [Thermoanaerobaculia bacterium]|jgi:hypothetical protein|nr:hypothetical protein [Thermoanaerobaculia bacterium]
MDPLSVPPSSSGVSGFDWLQTALAESNELLVFLRVVPSFRSVPGDLRFVEVLRRIGLS